LRNLDELFAGLAQSAFRRSFQLRGKELGTLHEKGLREMMRHARDIIGRRLAPGMIPNDGKQTPFRGHPVFVAQHATACYCRGCLQKWQRIARGRPLTDEEGEYVLRVLQHWRVRNI
jgi:hypothetical protein